MKRFSRFMMIGLLVGAMVFAPWWATTVVQADQHGVPPQAAQQAPTFPVAVPKEKVQPVDLTDEGIQSLLLQYFAGYWAVTEKNSDLKPLTDFVNQYWSDPKGENAQRVLTVAGLIHDAHQIRGSWNEELSSAIASAELSDLGEQMLMKALVITSYYGNRGGWKSPVLTEVGDRVELYLSKKTGMVDKLVFGSDFDEALTAGKKPEQIIQRLKDDLAEGACWRTDPLKYVSPEQLTINGKPLREKTQELASPQATSYNRADATKHANDYAFSIAPGYIDYYTQGGDCTNFVSQCLREGGAPDDSIGVVAHTWFYGRYGGGALGTDPSIHRTSSWTGVNELYTYLTANTSSGPGSYATTAQFPLDYYYDPSLQLGDLIQFKSGGTWGHSAIVTWKEVKLAIDYPGQIYDEYHYWVTYHSTGEQSNKKNEKVDGMYYSNWRPLPIFIR